MQAPGDAARAEHEAGAEADAQAAPHHAPRLTVAVATCHTRRAMTDPLFWHRIQFGFTITFHYLFPQLTMGLALLVLLFKLRGQDATARFWVRVLGINFAFFLESSFLALVIYGESRLSRRAHTLATAALFAGSWISGYFIIVTNAFMQHPVGYTLLDGKLP